MENPEKNWQHWGHKTEDELKQTKTQSKKYNTTFVNYHVQPLTSYSIC
jgi:hypothetical protein